MKSTLFTLGFGFLLVALLAACTLVEEISSRVTTITGLGNVVTQEENITGFDKVDVSNAFKVDIRQGDSFRVVIRVDDNLLEYLDVAKRGSTLRIGLEPGRAYNIRRATMEADVTMPELTSLELSGATQATISGFESTERLDVDVSGASQLRGDIEAGDARFEVSGASQVTLSGSAGDVTINVSGASTANLADFSVGDASVEASGASKVTVNTSGRLDAEASGASSVFYLGNPTLGNIDTSGASSVERK
jgi:hypothetical protein